MPQNKNICCLGEHEARCLTASCPDYKWYGARGIKLCDKWMKFEGFLEDMGHVPEGLEIDRIDNDGNYTKDNCKWTTHKENCSHRRNGRFVNLTGVIFGRVTALSSYTPGGRTQWYYSCSCGNKFVTLSHSLIQGRTKSCGCVRREKTILRNRSLKGVKRNANL
jgi:hypothetical protein